MSDLTEQAQGGPYDQTTSKNAKVLKGRRRTAVVVAVAGAVVVILAAVGWRLFGPNTFTLRGTVVLDSGWTAGPGRTCIGKAEFTDIHAGTQVTVTDATGAIIALGRLGDGMPKETDCRFPINVEGVPRGKAFYGVMVSDERRGVTRYSEADLVDRGVQLTLGALE